LPELGPERHSGQRSRDLLDGLIAFDAVYDTRFIAVLVFLSYPKYYMPNSAIPKRRQGRQPALGSDPDKARELVIQAFLGRARQVGIRSVVMGELANELRMSPSTLYRYFRSKGELVEACVERWAEDLAAATSIDDVPSGDWTPAELVGRWADSWSDAVSRYSSAWWSDLRRGYPDAWNTFERAMRTQKQRGAAILRPNLRKDVHAEVALAVLELILDNISDPDMCERLGVTRRDAIQNAIAVWTRGAMVSERAPRLRAVEPLNSEDEAQD
jgi:AcrR family transcriptional regulator